MHGRHNVVADCLYRLTPHYIGIPLGVYNWDVYFV